MENEDQIKTAVLVAALVEHGLSMHSIRQAVAGMTVNKISAVAASEQVFIEDAYLSWNALVDQLGVTL